MHAGGAFNFLCPAHIVLILVKDAIGRRRVDSNIIIQIVACALATLCSIGAMTVAVWSVHESRRPQPVAFLEHVRDKSCVLFVVENFGTGVASNIEIIGFDYALVGERKMKNVERSFVETGIPMLVPGARRDTLLLGGADDMRKRLGTSCSVTLRYSERGLLGRPKRREEEFLLDMGSFAGSLYTISDFHKMVVATESMAESLKRMSK